MIILVQNNDDRKALSFIIDAIDKEFEKDGDFIFSKPIYEAIIINIDDRN